MVHDNCNKTNMFLFSKRRDKIVFKWRKLTCKTLLFRDCGYFCLYDTLYCIILYVCGIVLQGNQYTHFDQTKSSYKCTILNYQSIIILGGNIVPLPSTVVPLFVRERRHERVSQETGYEIQSDILILRSTIQMRYIH